MFDCIPRAGNIASVLYYSAVIERNKIEMTLQLILKKIAQYQDSVKSNFSCRDRIEPLEGRMLTFQYVLATVWSELKTTYI